MSETLLFECNLCKAQQTYRGTWNVPKGWFFIAAQWPMSYPKDQRLGHLCEACADKYLGTEGKKQTRPE